jgi:diguanylate cyclase (GGDEF)-like protein
MAVEARLAPAGRLVLLVVVAAAVALVSAALAGWAAASGPSLQVGRGLLCIAVIYVGVSVHLRTRLGAQRLELSWGEAAMMLALTLVPPAWVVLCTPVGVGLRLVGRQPAIKSVYNLSSYTVAAAGAALVSSTQPYAAGNLSALVVLALAGLVGGLITHVAVAGVIAVAQDTSLLASWRAGAGLQLLSVAGNVATALVVIVLAGHDARLIAALPIVGLCLHQGYMGRLRGREERTAAQRQLEAVDALAADLDEAAVASRAAAEIADLLAADVVEVELFAASDRDAVVYQHCRRGVAWRGDPGQVPTAVGRLLAQVSIAGTGDPVGQIRVWLAGGSADLQLSTGDQVAVRTLAAAAHTALANARAHERLRMIAERQTYQATHDRITGLPVHDLLIEHVDRHLARARADGAAGPVAVGIVDISGFRETVRTLGRAAAHHLLSHAAERLGAAVAPGEYLAHVGGDSFAVFTETPGPEHVRERMLAMLSAVSTPVRLEEGGAQVSLDATTGIAYCATPAATGGAELLRQATVALDQARTIDLQVAWYDPAADLASPPALVLASELRAALVKHELELHYQPIIDLAGGYPVAVEALVRWRHPDRGLLRPMDFLRVIQRSPRDHAKFSRWYLDAALRERSQWGDDRDLPIAINVDKRSLLDEDLVGQVADALDRAGIGPDQLMFELAETALSGLDSDDVLSGLRTLGIRLAIDDFGTGYGSLTRLLRVPATNLKIAPELVADMLASEQATALVQAAINIGRTAGLQVTALGVTSADQAGALSALGCPAGQGRHLGLPLSSALLRRYLATAPDRPTAGRNADVIPLQSRRASAGSSDPGGRT